MITAYHSTVLDYPVDRVWSLIRDFNNYPAYIDGVSASVIGSNKRGDEVGAVRRFKYGDNWIRQRLSGGIRTRSERSATRESSCSRFRPDEWTTRRHRSAMKAPSIFCRSSTTIAPSSNGR